MHRHPSVHPHSSGSSSPRPTQRRCHARRADRRRSARTSLHGSSPIGRSHWLPQLRCNSPGWNRHSAPPTVLSGPFPPAPRTPTPIPRAADRSRPSPTTARPRRPLRCATTRRPQGRCRGPKITGPAAATPALVARAPATGRLREAVVVVECDLVLRDRERPFGSVTSCTGIKLVFVAIAVVVQAAHAERPRRDHHHLRPEAPGAQGLPEGLASLLRRLGRLRRH